MNRKEIEAYVASKNSTILNFSDRGPWGNNRYRGNCSGWIIAYLIWRYGVKSLAELFAGGRNRLNISYVGSMYVLKPGTPGTINRGSR